MAKRTRASRRSHKRASTSPRPRSIIGSFLTRTFVSLIPAVAVWYWARDYVVAPAAWLAGKAMRLCFPGWVSGSRLNGIELTLLMKAFSPSGPAGPTFPASQVDVSVLKYCYGLPLLVALFLGSRAKGLRWKLPACALGLVPFQAWGLCFAWMIPISTRNGDLSNLTVLGYQMGFLLFPTLVPLAMWAYLERQFIAAVAAEGSLAGSTAKGEGEAA
jgi:hypothetical protein